MKIGFGSATLVASALLCSCVDPEDGEVIQEITTESAACKVVYTTSDWDSGFTASVRITNKGAARNGWQLRWSYAAGQRVGSIWNATVVQNAATVTVSAVGWNANLGAGASVELGFNGQKSGANPAPGEFFLDGVSCGTGSAPPPPPPPGGGGTCNATDWVAGRAYVTGNIVRYPSNGQHYIAEHDNPGYDPIISTWFWDPTTCTGGGGGGGGGGNFGSLVSRSAFESMFPSRSAFYTYDGLIAATATYPGFSGEGDPTTRKREAAAFLANVGHETGDLVYVEEIAQGEYCAPSASCPCQPGQRYFGRGPIQLSWNYNYCAAGAALGLDLRADPGRVSRDATVAWQTGLWFWMTQSGAGSMPAHRAMVDGRGFGETIRTINGSLECNGGRPDQVQSRIDRYRRFCQVLGVDPGANLGC